MRLLLISMKLRQLSVETGVKTEQQPELEAICALTELEMAITKFYAAAFQTPDSNKMTMCLN